MDPEMLTTYNRSISRMVFGYIAQQFLWPKGIPFNAYGTLVA